ncbi:glycosyltransferase [Rubrimonas cliftonensis]|uniref:Glycosyltransferase involved in cell wall bisynthesis n=1 Tax=Rubrimonas cliftonensis TaxID=89524 RepID=A0A1H4CV88_9RHOB|nr:glycosyltransferase [Rubrimonas cliftonensis]SEA64291.1 Glycosyltransferase involved in cell wall bisynthesis [Rubrimonas cliftonensis]
MRILPVDGLEGDPAAPADVLPEHPPRVETLMPKPFDGYGPSWTCGSIVSGMARFGAPCRVTATRVTRRIEGLALRAALPAAFNSAPYRYVRRFAERRAERVFLRDVGPGDIAYIWQNTSLETTEALARRGALVVLECINTHQRHARNILDAEFDRIGLPPSHGITERSARELDQKLATAHAVFAPSRAVEISLLEAGLPEEKVLPASYGAWMDAVEAPAPRGRRPVFIFVASVSVRKGAHLLLRAWRRAGLDAELRVLGAVSDDIARSCADALAASNVKVMGFRRDVSAQLAQADVFVLPSLEEGDPIATYEAAFHGLPIIASPMGGGRMGDDPERLRLVDPRDEDAMVAILRELAGSEELRRHLGAKARRAAARFEWPLVGARRVESLMRLHGARVAGAQDGPARGGAAA